MTEKKSAVLTYLRKERAIFARYNRSHPHFERNLILDAVISILIVSLCFGVINHNSERGRVDVLVRSGAVAMTSSELIHHVKSEKIGAYWFGPMKGYKYTIICTDRQEIIVSYVPQGVSLNHPDRFNLTLETYSKSLASEVRPMSNLVSDRDDFVTASGAAVTLFSDRPQMVKFAIPGVSKYVEVQYPSSRRIYDVYKDAESLRLISKS